MTKWENKTDKEKIEALELALWKLLDELTRDLDEDRTNEIKSNVARELDQKYIF